MSSREVIVSISLASETFRVGTLWFHVRKGRESASFEYDKAWLTHLDRFTLKSFNHPKAFPILISPFPL